MQKTRTEDRDGKIRSSTTYDTFAEFMDDVQREPSQKHGSLHSRKTSKPDWHGTPNFETAIKLAREGWPKGLEMIERLTARLENVTSSMMHKPEIAWDVAGDFADAGLFTTGVPECMGSFVESDQVTAGSGKVVRILMNLSVSGGVDSESIMRRGAACCALVDALESIGRSCEIVIAACGGGYGNAIHDHIVTVKHAGEPLELDRMAFLLAHPSSFRRLFFSAWEHEPDDIRTKCDIIGSGRYGRCVDLVDESANITVPTMDLYSHPNDEAILAWIGEQLRAQGCEMEGDETLSKN